MAVDNGEVTALVNAASGRGKAPADFIAHLFAELFPARRPFLLGYVETVEDVEIFQDRVAVARHRQDAQQFARRSARARDLPAPDGVAAIAGRKAAELGHVGGGQGAADRVTEIAAELSEFWAGHEGQFQGWGSLAAGFRYRG